MTLFQADSKVQKDRTVLRDTDARMARFSGRGLVINVLTYLLCLSIGYLPVIAPTTTVVLTVGLLITTLIRSYILIRFEALYSRGPQRWRNSFFAATLLGAAWWSVILVVITLTLGMVGETPLLWMYTIIFFSATVHFTSPYYRFTQLYLITALLPPTVAAVYMGGVDGYMYGLMLVIFLGLLHQLVGALSESYWERLEANYTLRKKAIALETEKRESDASVHLSSEFLSSLGHEFRTSLNDILGGLTLLTDTPLEGQQKELLKLARKAGERQLDLVTSIMDFARINSRTLVLDHAVFNLRSQLEQWIGDQAVDAHQQGVEIDYSLQPSVPVRALGDASRIGQVFKSLFSNAIQFSEQGRIFVAVDFSRDGDKSGHLEILITDQLEVRTPTPAATETAAEPDPDDNSQRRERGLWYTICRSLAECLGGSVDIDSGPAQETHYWLRLPLTLAGQPLTRMTSHPKLKDKPVLVLSPGQPLGSFHLQAMRDWGLQVEEAESSSQALQRLQERAATTDPFQLLVLNLPPQPEPLLSFARQRLADPQTAAVSQLLLLSHNHWGQEDVQQYLQEYPQTAYQFRPLVHQVLHDHLTHCLLGKPAMGDKSGGDDQEDGSGWHILLVEDHRVNQMVAEGMLKKLGCQVELAANGNEALEAFRQGETDLVLMDCQMPEMDGFEATRRIRQLESEAGGDTHIPIIAMTAHTGDEDQTQCFACGMDDYLPKPIAYEALQSLLLRWLGARQQDY